MLLSELKFTDRKNYKGPTQTQRCKVKCDNCDKEFYGFYWKIIEQRDRFSKDLCRSCKLHDSINFSFIEKHKQIYIKMNRKNKGKTLEEIYGEEKASKIRKKFKKSLRDRGFSENSISAWVKAGQLASSKKCKNKTLEEIVGIEKSQKIKKNLSEKFSGKNNPMYGKPSPIGSGNGWSGWYKNWYFRSLLELSFMINYIEKQNLQWESGERAKYNISYTDWEGKERSYFPDFILEENRMIEIKPTNLRNSKNVLLKENAAMTWCNEHNFEYQIVKCDSFDKLTNEEIKILRNTNQIKFLDRYEKLYKGKYEKI